MEDKISILLKEYGLEDNEIKVYLFLVGNGETSAYRVAKETKIHKSTCYDILDRLIIKGFASNIEKNKKSFYSALDINQTITKLRDRENVLLAILPEIEQIKKREISKVRVFENKESQKQFTFNLFSQIQKGLVKEVYLISGGPSGVTGVLQRERKELVGEEGFEIFLEKLIEEMKKGGFNKTKKYRGIWNEKFKGSKLLKMFRGLGEDRFLNKLPTLATTIIFGECVAFSFTFEGNHQVIEIQNSLIAEEMKAYFSYLWEIAKE